MESAVRPYLHHFEACRALMLFATDHRCCLSRGSSRRLARVAESGARGRDMAGAEETKQLLFAGVAGCGKSTALTTFAPVRLEPTEGLSFHEKVRDWPSFAGLCGTVRTGACPSSPRRRSSVCRPRCQRGGWPIGGSESIQTRSEKMQKRERDSRAFLGLKLFLAFLQ